MVEMQTTTTAGKKIRISEDVDWLLTSLMLPRETYNGALRRILVQAGKRKAHA